MRQQREGAEQYSAAQRAANTAYRAKFIRRWDRQPDHSPNDAIVAQNELAYARATANADAHYRAAFIRRWGMSPDAHMDAAPVDNPEVCNMLECASADPGVLLYDEVDEAYANAQAISDEDPVAISPSVERGAVVDLGNELVFEAREDGRLIKISHLGQDMVIHEDPAHDLLKLLANVLL